MKVSIKGFITCKSAEQYIDCADNYDFNKNNHRFSVSDGVSKSFFPKVWSEILVSKFVERTDLNESDLIKESDFIKECQLEWQKRIDEIVKSFETDPKKWHTRTLYNRKEPALATFVGLQFFEKEKKWSAWALGDSFLFFIPSNYKNYQKELVKLSSKKGTIVFDNFPDYFSSVGNNHNGIIEPLRSQKIVDGTFFLMTDALAEWFLKEGENAIGKIAVWKSQTDFEKFITLAIDENQLTNDDCAILCIEISEVDRKGIEYKKPLVTDLNDLISEQEAVNEKTKLRKLEEEKLKQKKEAENQKDKELEASQNESLTPENIEAVSNEEQPKASFMSKVIVLFSGKGKDETTETVKPEKKNGSELENIEEQQSDPVKEEPIDSEITLAENRNLENDKNEEIGKENIEEEAKNEKIEPEKIEPIKQQKIDSKAKSIIDRFEKK